MFNFNSITAIQFRRWLLTALASYLIAGAFAAGYVITVNERPNHPTYALVVGALIAGPLALAFLWPRLKGVKAFGVEISLADVTIPIANRVADELMTNQYFSGVPHLLSNISQAVENPDLQLVEINLRSEPYWWSTRLYLQATLLHDYSNVQRLVFVEGDEERR